MKQDQTVKIPVLYIIKQINFCVTNYRDMFVIISTINLSKNKGWRKIPLSKFFRRLITPLHDIVVGWKFLPIYVHNWRSEQVIIWRPGYYAGWFKTLHLNDYQKFLSGIYRSEPSVIVMAPSYNILLMVVNTSSAILTFTTPLKHICTIDKTITINYLSKKSHMALFPSRESKESRLAPCSL